MFCQMSTLKMDEKYNYYGRDDHWLVWKLMNLNEYVAWGTTVYVEPIFFLSPFKYH